MSDAPAGPPIVPGGSVWLFSGGTWRCLDGTDDDPLHTAGEDDGDLNRFLERLGYLLSWTWDGPSRTYVDGTVGPGSPLVSVWEARTDVQPRPQWPWLVEPHLVSEGYVYVIAVATLPDLLALSAQLAPLAEAVCRGHRHEAQLEALVRDGRPRHREPRRREASGGP
jgi:hypothetical protein